MKTNPSEIPHGDPERLARARAALQEWQANGCLIVPDTCTLDPDQNLVEEMMAYLMEPIDPDEWTSGGCWQ